MLTPEYSTSQKIGDLGRRVFIGGHPDSWHQESEPQQGGDFGFDASMWLEDLGHIRGRFSVQIKSGANPKISGSAPDQFISVQLTPQVCNLYLQDGQPVLLVFVALQSESSTEAAKMHYLWIEESLRERLGSRLEFDGSDPDSMTFRVPITNELTKQLDVSDHLEKYWSYTRIANRLRSPAGAGALGTVSSLSPRGLSALTATDAADLDRWLTNESLKGDNLWPTPKSGTAVAKIKQIAEFLAHGNVSEADSLIGETNQMQLEDPEVLAELRYQEGRRAFLDDRADIAKKRFSEACELQPDRARYLAAEIEATVAANQNLTPRVPPELLERASKFDSDQDVRFQLARAFAINSDYAKAEELIAHLDEPNRVKAETLCQAIKGDWEATLRSATRGISQDQSNRTNSFLKILRLRALLNIVTGGNGNLSVGGRPDLKISDACALREGTLEALREANASGWPANSEMALDCASAVCLIFGPDRELLDLITEFARKRPSLRSAHETLARIATFIGEPLIAIKALKNLNNPDSADLARLALLLSESGAHLEAVDIALTKLIDKPHDSLVDVAVAMASISAYRLGSTADEATLRTFVQGGDPAAQHLLNFVYASLKNPEAREQNLDSLWREAMRDGGSELLQDNLFQYLSVDRDNDTDRIIELSSLLVQRRSFTEMEAAKYSAALLRRQRYLELEEFTARTQDFYPNNETIGLTRAIALERIGQPSAAERVLRRFENSARADLISARTQLLLRIGDVDALILLTKRSLAATTDHGDRFHYLRTLATLYSRRDRAQYLETVWRLGETADQNVESEEGAFLLHFFMATSSDGIEVSQPRILEFQDRLKRFTEKFPESHVLRAGHISDDASPEELLAQLYKMSGMTHERARAQSRARTFGERNGSHIPLSFRPKTFAPYASNLVELLRITTNAWEGGESSRIIIGDPAFPSSNLSLPPILDLSTMLLLVELDLFDKLFSIWTAIAIPKDSLAHLSELMFEPSDPGSLSMVDKTVDALRKNHAAIIQPAAPTEANARFPHSEFSTIKAEVAAQRYAYLTLDLAAAALLNAENNVASSCRTIWDLLFVLEAKGSLNKADATLVRLRLASWNSVGAQLETTDVAAAARGSIDADQASHGSPAARAVMKFLTSRDSSLAIKDSASILIHLADHAKPSDVEAAKWFARILYREALLARSIEFSETADDLTARLAVLSVIEVYKDSNAQTTMSFIWNVLEELRSAFGGGADKDQFFRLLGILAARLFDGVVKKHGLTAMTIEAKVTELLFSITTTGTQDRAVLEGAYFEQTRILQG